MRALTAEMKDIDHRPYFLWDEDISIRELQQILSEGTQWDRERLVGKMLREARDLDVWHFVTPAEVQSMLPQLSRRLGKRRAFWEFLIEGWRADGLLQS